MVETKLPSPKSRKMPNGRRQDRIMSRCLGNWSRKVSVNQRAALVRWKKFSQGYSLHRCASGLVLHFHQSISAKGAWTKDVENFFSRAPVWTRTHEHTDVWRCVQARSKVQSICEPPAQTVVAVINTRLRYFCESNEIQSVL